ncbi:MAG: hypothetical protein J6K04_04675 [Lachnospiraceae bacterium]|nr:hypothetical protein [Lachnospiraceae bacterium]
MPKNDNAQSIRMVESLRKNGNMELAEQLAKQHPLSKSASIEKKLEWAQNACAFLEEHLEEQEIIKVRKECRCNDGKSIAKKLLKYLNKTESIEDFVEEFNQNETFASLEYISDHKLLFCYPECYCACVKRISESVSRTWCYCTLGNAEGIFREVFQKDVMVTLVESIKTGAKRCAIVVEW